jgi:predicted Ser/Thr protein kinase
MTWAMDEMTTNARPFFATDEGPRSLVAGHYEVDLARPLGSGGMAVVYKGKDTRTRREVALKTLRVEYRRDPETRARFRREARTMAFLTHPNVARVYDLYEDDEAPWAIVEFVPGQSLKQRIASRGVFSPEETSLVLEQAARALDHLHSRGLVHLDVKPQNLIRTPEGVVKLIDFGLAQQSGAPQEMIGGQAFGTAAYLAPEQGRGDPVVPATDVYALGCVVYEMLTGAPPFESAASSEIKNDVIRAHLNDAPAPPTLARPDLNLPAWIDDVVLWALAKQPGQRYQDCMTFANVFRSGLESAAGLDDAPTATVWSPGVADTHEVEDEAIDDQRRSGLGRRAISSLYQTGGEAARHTGWLRRKLWRAVTALAIGNLLLAGLLYFSNGEIPGVYARALTLANGGRAEVTTDQLRLRADPGTGGQVLALLPVGTGVKIVSGPTSVDGELWWQVEYQNNSQTMTGYVSAGWLAPQRESAGARLKHLANDGLDKIGVPDRLRL